MSIARLKITLDELKPAIMRRIEVPLAIKLADLHLVIQAAMPWENYHLYEFRAGGIRWGIPNPEFDFESSALDARKVTLLEVREQTGGKSLKYLYDFGDGWEHAVKIEKILEPETGAVYPRLIDAKYRCPPEDVGGPWGYMEYLDAIADPKHKRHKEMISWRGSGFDPTTVDLGAIASDVAKLARKSTRKATKPSRSKSERT